VSEYAPRQYGPPEAISRAGESAGRVRPFRDRCPGVTALHHAADGLLARIRVPGGRLSPRQLRAVAGASELGSGLVELTSRGNLQLRGLSPATASRLSDRLAAVGLLPSPSHDLVRNVLASPFGGRHSDAYAATDEVVAALDRQLIEDDAFSMLPGRFLFAVDDGSRLSGVEIADVGLVALPDGHFRLYLAGQSTGIVAESREAPAIVLAAARAFLIRRRSHDASAWRIAELTGGAGGVAGDLGTPLGAAFGSTPAPFLGLHPQRDGRHALHALVPLARLEPGVTARLATILGDVALDARLSRWRTLTVVDVEPAETEAVRGALEALGLVTEPGSGWHGLSACAGLGCCAHATWDVRAMAAARAGVRTASAPPEHLTACSRRCGAAA
jgi:sulfite reductase beta subunit-like hemoprotein